MSDKANSKTKKSKKIQFVEDDLDVDDTGKKGKPFLEEDTKPEWFAELTDDQIHMFKEVFELLDADGGGSIDASELYTCLKELDVDIQEEEIRTVLKELDKDGNGEIDFDEFLYCMTATDRYLDMLAEGEGSEEKEQKEIQYSKRQSLFFSAITKFALKNSLGEIGRYYANKARQVPHVINHYTAGARLIGLTDRQLAKHYKDMQASFKDQKLKNSPYAKPLQFVIPAPQDSSKKSRNVKTKKMEIGPASSFENAQMQAARARGRRAIIGPSDAGHLMETLELLASKGSVVAKLPDAHLIPHLRRLASAASQDAKLDIPIKSSLRYKRRHSMQSIHEHAEHKHHRRPSTTRGSKHVTKSTERQAGWHIPPLERSQIPLPTLKLSVQDLKNPTIEDLPKIRQKVSETINGYYSALRQRQVRLAWKHWDTLHAKCIPGKKLLENFRQVYLAYSPHKEEDCFVICPWIPGPRYGRKSPTDSSRPVSAYSTY